MLQHHTTSARSSATQTSAPACDSARKCALLWDTLTENEHLMLCYLEEKDWPIELCVKVRPFRDVVVCEE